jgi:hypothetical protein
LYIENEEFVDRAVLIRAAAQDASPSPKFAVLVYFKREVAEDLKVIGMPQQAHARSSIV